MRKVVTFGEIMMRLSPPGFLRLSQTNSFDINYGARPLRRIIQKEIETKIANNILENNYLNKKEINVSIRRGKISVD